MRAPEFWRRDDTAARLLRAAMGPFSWAYGASVAWKARHALPYHAKAKVICVGNLTVGGTGKTPVAIAIAQALIARGRKPAFVSRGYGGKQRGPLAVNSYKDRAADVGDEPLLLALTAPTFIARDRAAAATLAEQNADVIVMDDGHQNFSLEKDLSLVVVDGEDGFGNGRVLPAGPLREPIAQGLARADAVIVLGDGTPDLLKFNGLVLRAGLRTTAIPQVNGKVVAFAGIGRPEKFFASLRAFGAEIVDARAYPDHTAYTAAEIARLKARARDAGAALITTEKDYVRLTDAERVGIAFLPVHAAFDDPAALEHLLDTLGHAV
jgi:tetraacyldisaccharide 4'-kinase